MCAAIYETTPAGVQVVCGITATVTGSAGAHQHAADATAGGGHTHAADATAGGGHTHAADATVGGGHTHSADATSAGSGSAHNNMPAYYQVLFIMKT